MNHLVGLFIGILLSTSYVQATGEKGSVKRLCVLGITAGLILFIFLIWNG